MTAKPNPPPAATEALLQREMVGPVAVLTLNRPKALNALSAAMLDAIRGELEAVADDKSVRAVIIRGAGRGFCAGHDLKEMTEHRADADGGNAFFKDLLESCSAMMLAIRALPVLVVAEVHGIATAAGCQLVAACDMAIAADDTRFGVNGINAGLFCSTPMVALSRNVPRKTAMEMLVLGEMIDAAKAQRAGLVNHVVAKDALSETTMKIARRAAQKSRAVVALGKRAFYDQLEMTMADAYRFTSDVIVENLMMRDAEIGIDAFLNKSTPQWEDQ